MNTIHAHLTFNGNCRQAMNFYQKCLGGTLTFQTVGASPLSGEMPEKMKKCILHATLTNKELVLMGSDMVNEKGLLRGNATSLVLNCYSEKELKEYYKKLSKGGEATHPLEDTFWNALLGSLTDKYGNTWILNYNRENKVSHKTKHLPFEKHQL